MYIPDLGSNVPTHSKRILKKLAAKLLEILGWRFEGEIPNIPKTVWIAAPHTSNWDAFWGLLAIFAMGVKSNWMAKHSLFQWPLHKIISSWGGVPVDRTAKLGIVEQMAEQFKKNEKLIVVIAPEGTRQKVDRWKTGFYHIAQNAGVPILAAFIDYKRKIFGFGPLIEVGGDFSSDMAILQKFFQDKTGFHPENYNSGIF